MVLQMGALLKAANDAAQAAVDRLIAQHGRDHPDFLFCGSAWVSIPGRGEFVNFLKRSGLGSKGAYKGWTLSPTFHIEGPQAQSETLRSAACRAFSEVLRANGVQSTVNTWSN